MGSDSEHADVVVVGSGFGGSVTAHRFAQAGMNVVVLERGKAYPPGSFARSPADMAKNFWDPSEGRHGLFDVWSFRDFEAVVSSGLGGGSLIYANVLLRKDEKWFVSEAPVGGGYEPWPISRADLEEHYDAVETMMGVQRFPKGSPGYQASRRTELLERAGDGLGYTTEQPPLAVTFAAGGAGTTPVPGAQIPTPYYGNLHDRPRVTCVLCGECDLGCNAGSKNTLDHTYLSAARHHGADIRVHHEVRSLTPRDGGGFTVGYVVHEPGTTTATADLPGKTITCDRLVLAAGTFGTVYLLLRNRAALPGSSSQLGRRFCGNGDLLGFVVGVPGEPLGTSRAPVITTAVRVPDELDGGAGIGRSRRGAYIEDAGFPGFVDYLLETGQVHGTAHRIARAAVRLIRARLTGAPSHQVGDIVGDLIGRGEASGGAMPLLGMGREPAVGVMSVRDDYLQITGYPGPNLPSFYDGMGNTMKDLSERMGGRLIEKLTRLARVITVHPLGGASMGDDINTGVVDGWGEVFGYPGLYVADGAAMPGPVGANPSLTIAAFADRLAEHALSMPAAVGRRSSSAGPSAPVAVPPTPEVSPAVPSAPVAVPPAPEVSSVGPSVGPSAEPPAPADTGTDTGTDVEQAGVMSTPTSLWFTEKMRGFLTLDETDSQRGYDRGRADQTSLMFKLTISTDDVDAFVADPRHEAVAVGYIDCDVLGGRRPVDAGVFNLFVAEEGETPRRRMLYRLPFTDAAGHPLTLSGVKDVHDDPGFDLWRDTSTLYTRIFAGHVDAAAESTAAVIGAGIVTIHVPDFLQQLTTFRASKPGGGGKAGIAGVEKFGRLFLGELWQVYGPAAKSPDGGDGER